MTLNDLEQRHNEFKEKPGFKKFTDHGEFEIDAQLIGDKFYVRISRGSEVIKFVAIGFAVDTVDVRVTRACSGSALSKQGTRTTCVHIE